MLGTIEGAELRERGGMLVLVLGGALSLLGACATEEQVTFGDPKNVAGATSSTGSSSGSGGGAGAGPCEENARCAVKFEDQVLPILDDKAKCSEAPCHAAGTAGLTLTAGDAALQRDALLEWVHKLSGEEQTGPYVVPCNPSGSSLLCNLAVDAAGEPNPFGECGHLMPKLDGSVDVDQAALSVDDVNLIAEWITCGAPAN